MDELEDTLRTYLDNSRRAMLWKAKGLSDIELTRPMVGTGTNLLGLVQHLGFIEYGYFVRCLGFAVEDRYYDALAENPDDSADMWVAADIECNEVRAFYQRAIEAANPNIAALPLDAPATVPWWPEGKRDTTLLRLLLQMNVETARHAGHADILRESIDGATGMREENTNMPPYDAGDWTQLHERILRASNSR